MKRFIIQFLGLCFILNTQHVEYQTIITEYYENGLAKTRWHVQQKDTFLIETFYVNGSKKEQIWHQDSTFKMDYDHQFYKEYGTPKHIQWLSMFAHLYTREQSDLYDGFFRDSTFKYGSKGQLIERIDAVADRLMRKSNYDLMGYPSTFKEYKKISKSVFQYLHHSNDFEQCFYLDTLNKKLIISITEGQKKWQEDTYAWNSDELLDRLQLLKQILYDSTGKPHSIWGGEHAILQPKQHPNSKLYGMCNPKNQWIIPPKYKSIETFKYFNIYYIVNEGNKLGIIDATGRIVTPTQWDLIELLQSKVEFLYDFERERMYSPIGSENKIRLKCGKNNLYGVLDVSGKMILKPIYQDVIRSHQNQFVVKIGKHVGMVNNNHIILIPPQYSDIDFSHCDDLFITQVQDKSFKFKYGLINQQGKVLVKNDFFRIYGMPYAKRCFTAVPFLSETARLEAIAGATQSGIFHAERGWLLDTSFQQIHFYSSPRYLIIQKMESKKMGIFSKADEHLLLPVDYQSITPFNQPQWINKKSFFLCEKGGKYGVFDPNLRKWIIPLQYNVLQPFGDSLFLALINGKWRWMDMQQKFISNERFDDMGIVGSELGTANTTSCFLRKKKKIFIYSSDSYPYVDNFESIGNDAFRKNPLIFVNWKGDTIQTDKLGRIIRPQ